MRKYVINNIQQGIDQRIFFSFFGTNIAEYFKKEVDILRQMGKLEIENDIIRTKFISKIEIETFSKVFFSKRIMGKLDKKYKNQYDGAKNYMEMLKNYPEEE
jgi:hypothetical protein